MGDQNTLSAGLRAVTVLHNTSSGTGNRAREVDRVMSALRGAGHRVRMVSLRGSKGGEAIDLASEIGADELVVVAGGDGTVHHALDALTRKEVAVFHYPLGTENLFSREFGSAARAQTLLSAISAWSVRTSDMGVCNGRMFAIMMSVGFDACVVERVAAARRGGITRAAYVRAGLRELADPRTPMLSIEADGRRIVDERRGLVVVANSRQYAARLDPARSAAVDDGQLDVVFYPHETRAGLALWMLSTATGRHVRKPDLVQTRASRIVIRTSVPSPHQMDGEAAGSGEAFEVTIRPSALRVLGVPNRGGG